MAIDLNTLREFEEAVREDIPQFRVAYKDQSKLMAFLGFLSYPFNEKFMTSFTTTWGWSVYFPNVDHYVKHPEERLRTLAHEYVHLCDTREHGLWFKLSYAFPQALAVIPLFVFAGMCWPHPWLMLLPFVGYFLGCLVAKLWRPLFWVVLPLFIGGTIALTWWLIAWWPLLALLAAVLCLVPWPAPWRTKWELRGYGMNVALVEWLYGRYGPNYRDAIVKHFVGPNYFFMSWNRKKIEQALDDTYQKAADGTLQGLSPYGMVHEFLYQRGLLRR